MNDPSAFLRGAEGGGVAITNPCCPQLGERKQATKFRDFTKATNLSWGPCPTSFTSPNSNFYWLTFLLLGTLLFN